MQAAKTLVRIQHGSHLYGTNTETSDLDYKGVFLPDGRDIILQRIPHVIDLGTGDHSTKNTKDDVDDQSYPLQKFLQMVAKGDTVGTEILFAPDWAIVEMDPVWEMIRHNRHVLLNKQCRGFVSYCQRQAAKYGIKGSRMAACKDIVDLLDAAASARGTSAKLELIADQLSEFCNTHEFSEIVDIPSQAGKELLHLDVVDRKIPFTNTIQHALSIYSKVYDNYGHRTRAAMNNEGVDWKAISHAIRVAGQAKELLTTGQITFPRPNCDLLLAVKRGAYQYHEVAPILEQLVEEVEEAALTSKLPNKAAQDGIDLLVLSLYSQQVTNDLPR